MFRAKITASRTINQTFKRFNSSGSHVTEPKPFEINITKIFGVAIVASGFLVYKNHELTDKPLIETKLYEQQGSSERSDLRNANYQKRYDVSFLKAFIRDKGGIGQRQYRRTSDSSAVPTNLIPSHSTNGNQFGAGIKTNALGPRKERIRVYAPIDV